MVEITAVSYYIDDILCTVVKSTTPYPEVWIRMFTSSKSRIKVMLDQENDPELDDGWSGYFIPRIFRTMPESTKFGAR